MSFYFIFKLDNLSGPGLLSHVSLLDWANPDSFGLLGRGIIKNDKVYIFLYLHFCTSVTMCFAFYVNAVQVFFHKSI